MNTSNRYVYVIGLLFLIVVVVVYSLFFGTKTYINNQYGFQFEYPKEFYLFVESRTPVSTSVEDLKAINEGIVFGVGEEHKEVNVEIYIPTSADELKAERSTLETATTGAVVQNPYKDAQKGRVVEGQNIRGIYSQWTSFEMGGEYLESFTTYTKNGERITIEVRISRTYPNPDPEYTEQERRDDQNRTIENIISLFEFLE